MTLTNHTRLYVPVISIVIVVLAFGPVFVFELLDGNSIWTMWKGLIVMLVCLGFLVRSLLNAVYELRIDSYSVTCDSHPRLIVEQLFRRRVYRRDELKDWNFLQADIPPGKQVPAQNAVVLLKFTDGVKFQGEVTRDEACRLATLLGE